MTRISAQEERSLGLTPGTPKRKPSMPKQESLCWTCTLYIPCPWPRRRVEGMVTVRRKVSQGPKSGKESFVETVIECPKYRRSC